MFSCGLFGIVLLVVCSLSVAVTGFPFRNGNSQYRRRMCDDIAEVTDNSTCKHEVYRNQCEKLACKNGLGAECDEPRSPFRFGECANGLLCNCGRCQGCLGGICFTQVLCYDRYRHSKRMNNYPSEYPIYNNYNEY